MLENIIGKKSHVIILRLLIKHETQEFCLEDISKMSHLSCGTVYPALQNLLQTRIITVRKAGRSLLYKINKKNLLFQSLQQLIKTEEEGYHTIAQEFISRIKTDSLSAIVLFGSVARKEETDISDIDLLVVFDHPLGLFTFMELKDHLEGILGTRVDLVTEKALHPHLRNKILKESIHVI